MSPKSGMSLSGTLIAFLDALLAECMYVKVVQLTDFVPPKND